MYVFIIFDNKNKIDFIYIYMEVTIMPADSFFSSNIDGRKKKRRERKNDPPHLKNKCGRTNKQAKEMRIFSFTHTRTHIIAFCIAFIIDIVFFYSSIVEIRLVCHHDLTHFFFFLFFITYLSTSLYYSSVL